MTTNNEQNAVVVAQPQQIEQPLTHEMTVSDVLAQVAKIQQVLRAVMKEGTHFGIIPGCPKPSLYKPGAEKIGMTFRLVPRFEGERQPIDLGNGHREYVIKCDLYHAHSGLFCGAGVGSCSTMEGKYRFRTGPKESTGQPVPQDYWTLRKTNPGKAQELIGGPGYSVAKNEAGIWEVCIQGDKVEYDNPADYYNTVLKMAKKRAHIDAMLTATAASDIFTQDLDDEDLEGLVSNGKAEPKQQEKPPVSQPQRQSASNGGNGNHRPAPQSDAEAQRELLQICRDIATAGKTVSSTDFVTFELVDASDSLDFDSLVKQVCTTLASFKGRNGIIKGKEAHQLTGTALAITLKKARDVLAKLEGAAAAA